MRGGKEGEWGEKGQMVAGRSRRGEGGGGEGRGVERRGEIRQDEKRQAKRNKSGRTKSHSPPFKHVSRTLTDHHEEEDTHPA